MSKAQNEMPDLGKEYQVQLMHELAALQRENKRLKAELEDADKEFEDLENELEKEINRLRHDLALTHKLYRSKAKMRYYDVG